MTTICGHYSYASEVIFESDVQLKKGQQTGFESVKAGASVKLEPGENAFVMTPQNLPILIYATQKEGSKIIVSNTSVAAALADQLQPSLEKATNEIIDGLRRAESYVKKRDFTQASSITAALKEKYRNISAVLFMSGTVYFLMNNKNSAIEDLQNGLRLDPNNEPAKKLLSQIKGTP